MKVLRQPIVLIYDSGVGGLELSRHLETLPVRTIRMMDPANLPYGDKAKDVLLEIVTANLRKALLFEPFISHIVLACGTVSSQMLPEVRAVFPDIQVIGVVPAIKPAAAKHRRILVLATSKTVHSPYTAQLIHDFAAGCIVECHSAPKLVTLAENKVRWGQKISRAELKSTLPAHLDWDAVVLGCTHFPWFIDELAELMPGVEFFHPGPAIYRRLALVEPSQAKHSELIVNGKAQSVGVLGESFDIFLL